MPNVPTIPIERAAGHLRRFVSAKHPMGETASLQALTALFDGMSDPVLVIDAQSGYVSDCNNAACAALGYSRADLLRLSVTDFDDLFSHVDYACLAAQNRTAQDDAPLKSVYRRASGDVFPIELRLKAAGDGPIRSIVAIGRDFSQQKHLEDEVRSARQQFASLLNNLPGVLHRWEVGAGLQLKFIDRKVQHLSGYSDRDFLTGRQYWMAIVADEDRERLARTIGEAITRRGSYDVTFGIIHRDGSRRVLRDTGHVVPGEPGDPDTVEGIVVDVTERAEQERILREAFTAEHRRYEQVVAASHQVVYEEDVASRTMVFSGSLFEVFGYTPEVHGSRPEDWRSRIHPDDFQRVLNELDQAVAARRPAESEYRYRHADGSYRWVWDRALCDFGDNGEVLRIVGMMQDITARKMLEAQIHSAQRMDTVGALAGGIAHDVNNYLTTMLGNIDIAIMRLGGDEEWPELRDAREAITGCADLVRSLLTFARQQDPARVPLDADAALRDSVRILQRLAGPGIDLGLDVEPGCPRFSADRVQLRQVLMNLVVNARDAMSGRGLIVIGANGVEGRHRESREPGRFVRIWVKDDGPGIAAHIRERIFEPYMTTRSIGEGTGLGLSIVHGIARSHGGWVEVDSREGEGATFSVYLPGCDG